MSGGRSRTAAVALLAVALAACGESTTAPEMPPAGTINLAGAWSGTWTYTAAGLTVTDDVTITLGQSGATASGTWTALSGATGQLSFNAMAATTGTLTVNQATLGSGSCNASTTVEGTASANQIELDLADIPGQGICQWGTGGRFELTR